MQNDQYVVQVQDNKVVGDPVQLTTFLSKNGYNNEVSNFHVTPYIIWGSILLILLFILSRSFVIVQQKSIKIIQRFGKFKKIATAGVNIKSPFDNVVGKMSLKIEQLAEDVIAKSKDNAFVTIPVKVQFQVLNEKAEQAFYALSNASEQIRAYITNVVRSTATTMTMEEVFQSKNKFEGDVKTELNEKFSNFGFIIVNVLVDNPLPSLDVVEAFNRVIASQRAKEAAVNEAEAVKIKTIAGAEAEAKSLTLKATAYVEQRKIMADGMKGVVDTDPGMLEYLIGIDRRDVIREAAKTGAMFFVPTEETSMGIAKVVAGLKTTK